MKQIPALNQQARELLKFTVLQYMLDSFCENPKIGRVFVDDVERPDTCILLLNHLLFVGGKISRDSLDFLVYEILTPEIRGSRSILYIYYGSEAWKDAISELFPGSPCYERSLYRMNPGCFDEQSQCESIVKITSQLMSSSVGNLEMITNEIMPGTYENMEDFLSRGIGYALIANEKIAGFCTSEYQSHKALAIGIEVEEAYQKRGYAKTMTRSLLRDAAHLNLSVYWECWKNNTPSINTAISCGFEKVADYPMLFIRFDAD